MATAERCHGARRALCIFVFLLLVAAVAVRAPSPSEVHARSYTLDLVPQAASKPTTVPAPISGVRDASVTVDVEVASASPSLGPPPPTATRPTPDVFLVVGVKTRALRGGDARRAIRETWAARAATEALGVRVVFLGCEPDLSVLSADRAAEALAAIAEEKAAYEDLLTDELQCQDSFFTLVDKTVVFFDLALRTFPTLAYAMVLDDDVFLRVDRLVALLRSDRIPNERFYGGNSAEDKQRRNSAPIRHPESRYFLPTEIYPIDELPPYVAGAHYMFSKDIVEFMARNRGQLRGLKGLDDVTMALWMLALGIRPVFLPEFQIVRTWNCTEDLISYADMSPTAILDAHANLAEGRPFCAGFDSIQWLKKYKTVFFDLDSDDDDTKDSGDVQFHWDIELDPDSSRLRVFTNITIANESVQLLYFPASAPYSSAFCNRVLPLLEAKLSILVGTNFCRLHRKLLLRFLKGHDASIPSLRPLLTVARHNLERDAIDDAANTTRRVLLVRVVAPEENPAVFVLTECLMAAVHADKHIVVVSEDDAKHTPSVVVAVIRAQSRAADAAAVDALARRNSDQRTKFLVLPADGRRLASPDSDSRLVVTTSDPATSHARQLYLPHAAVVLAGATRYSPIVLLYPVESTEPQPRGFAILHGERCPPTREQSTLLDQLKGGDISSACHDEPSGTEAASATSQTPTDDTIDLYARYKFVVVLGDDDAWDDSEGVAMALLAGSIPIYVGRSGVSRRIFNPNAYIDCARFASISACGEYVHEVHRSPAAYEALRSQPPVANVTAFVEAFSWHPQVAEIATNGDYEGVRVGRRLSRLWQE